MPTYVAQLVYAGVLDEPEAGDPARLEVVAFGTDRSVDYARLEALARAYGRERESQPFEFPQGSGKLKFLGVRAIDESALLAPTSPVLVAGFDLEPDDPNQIDALLRGDLVRVMFDG
jgi:hypothetical protein